MVGLVITNDSKAIYMQPKKKKTHNIKVWALGYNFVTVAKCKTFVFLEMLLNKKKLKKKYIRETLVRGK